MLSKYLWEKITLNRVKKKPKRCNLIFLLLLKQHRIKIYSNDSHIKSTN